VSFWEMTNLGRNTIRPLNISNSVKSLVFGPAKQRGLPIKMKFNREVHTIATVLHTSKLAGV